jgi:hypothetical protein
LTPFFFGFFLDVKKKPVEKISTGFWKKSLAVSYFRMKKIILSSALSVFTTEFGMDSGGTHSLWPPGNGYAIQ